MATRKHRRNGISGWRIMASRRPERQRLNAERSEVPVSTLPDIRDPVQRTSKEMTDLADRLERGAA
jgi:hypothetical protein